MFKKLFRKSSKDKKAKEDEDEIVVDEKGNPVQGEQVNQAENASPSTSKEINDPQEQTHNDKSKNTPTTTKKADKADNEKEKQKELQQQAKALAAKATIGSDDYGATLYRRLEADADARAKGEVSSFVVGSTFTMPIPGTETAKAAVAAQSSAVRTTRLMKEFERVSKSVSVKTGVFSVSLVDENLSEWDVKFFKFDTASILANDLANMELDYQINNVWFRFSFPDNYPFAPPFVRVLAPYVQGGYVLSGGAICLGISSYV